MDDRSTATVVHPERRATDGPPHRPTDTAPHRRMREDGTTGFVAHPAWYPSAGSLPLPDGHGPRRPSPDAPPPDGSPPLATGERIPLLDGLPAIRHHWTVAQARFVDDPLVALAGAQSVLDELTRELDRALRGEREALARRWVGTDEHATEPLRQVMRCYGTIIERLLRV